jgi:pimeloyl-ACP methyl ester carboxylesterase
MLAKLEHDPVSVVRDFLINCYSPAPARMVMSAAVDAVELNPHALRRDLALLNESQLSLAPLLQAPQVLLMHGTADGIVHHDHSKQLQAELPNSTLILFASEGHALPFTNPSGCHLALRQAVYDRTRQVMPWQSGRRETTEIVGGGALTGATLKHSQSVL